MVGLGRRRSTITTTKASEIAAGKIEGSEEREESPSDLLLERSWRQVVHDRRRSSNSRKIETCLSHFTYLIGDTSPYSHRLERQYATIDLQGSGMFMTAENKKRAVSACP